MFASHLLKTPTVILCNERIGSPQLNVLFENMPLYIMLSIINNLQSDSLCTMRLMRTILGRDILSVSDAIIEKLLAS
jgi:hypothetical protein